MQGSPLSPESRWGGGGVPLLHPHYSFAFFEPQGGQIFPEAVSVAPMQQCREQIRLQTAATIKKPQTSGPPDCSWFEHKKTYINLIYLADVFLSKITVKIRQLDQSVPGTIGVKAIVVALAQGGRSEITVATTVFEPATFRTQSQSVNPLI